MEAKNQLTYPDVRSDDVVHSTYYNVLHDAEIDGKRCVFEEKAERMLIPKGKDQTKGKTEYVTDVRFSIHFDCVHAVCTEGTWKDARDAARNQFRDVLLQAPQSTMNKFIRLVHKYR